MHDVMASGWTLMDAGSDNQDAWSNAWMHSYRFGMQVQTAVWMQGVKYV